MTVLMRGNRSKNGITTPLTFVPAEYLFYGANSTRYKINKAKDKIALLTLNVLQLLCRMGYRTNNIAETF